MRSNAPPPTKEEDSRMDALVEFGCIACYLDGKDEDHRYAGCCEVHHFLSGNKRMGHWATVGLCQPHHTGPSGWHKNRRRFRSAYGNDMDLLAINNEKIGYQ